MEPTFAERLAAGPRAVESLVAELLVVALPAGELLVVELPAGELLAAEPGVRQAQLSFAALYSLAVAARKNQCWSRAALALHSARKMQTQQSQREGLQ